jgi:nitrogen fixation NifU-like protein
MSCGDKIRIEIILSGNRIEDIRFTGEGCAINQAAASMLTEKVKGKSVAEIMKLDLQYVEGLLGTTLTPSRVKCAMLPLEAIQKAIWTQTTQK